MIMFLIMAIATVLLMVLVSVGVYIGMKQSEKQECEDRITDCEEMQLSSSMLTSCACANQIKMA